MIELLLKSTLIGFSIAMPVGPIGLLCLRNSLTSGILAGLMTGLGAALADALYGLLAGFGVASLAYALGAYEFPLKLIGILFLLYLGVSTYREKPSEEVVKSERCLGKTFGASFFLTLINPMTILSFMGIFTALSSDFSEGSPFLPLIMAGGVFVGSCLWWLVLSLGAGLMKSRLNSKGRALINRISGGVLIAWALTLITTSN